MTSKKGKRKTFLEENLEVDPPKCLDIKKE